MSIIFGLLKERGGLVSESELQCFAAPTRRYATSVGSVYARGRLGMGVHPYFSHQRSAMEDRPVFDLCGHVLSFDGRLDNHEELADLVGIDVYETSDSQIVLSAFAKWGEACFSRFVGDWALALWSERDQALYLARDHAGTRTLYFLHENDRVTWSTYLDPFRTRANDLGLSENYVACYLSARHIRHFTPYEGVCSVRPAHYLVFRNGAAALSAHWTSTIRTAIRYRSDAEYEAHFLALFQQSVERRTGPGAPILAQLSGGMDSTAIVCMSDHLRQASNSDEEILDTVSYYDDSEDTLNERPYFSVTEARRGKIGIHLNAAYSQRTFQPPDGAYLLPGADSFSLEQEHQFDVAAWQRGYRSILSGIGGDEVLGGNPIAFPELADYLVSGDLPGLLRQSIAWSLVDRSPLLVTLYGTAQYVIRLYTHSGRSDTTIPPWISKPLRESTRAIEATHAVVPSRLGIAPHRIDNALAWWAILETLPHLFPQVLARPEYRYPYLDKDLVNYLFSIPRDQVLRPGRRRSLMRRALVDIVPHEILERRRKAFQLRAPLRTLQQAQSTLERLFVDSALGSSGFVDIDELRTWLGRTAQGDPTWRQALVRAIALELWLQGDPFEDGRHSAGREEARLHLSLTA
jgi:asparagine synthase (glutamine-hydrolysing)